MHKEIEEALNKIRPALQAHGGDVELLAVEKNQAKVRLTGACGGCPMSQITLKMGVEKALKEAVPEIREVVTVD